MASYNSHLILKDIKGEELNDLLHRILDVYSKEQKSFVETVFGRIKNEELQESGISGFEMHHR